MPEIEFELVSPEQVLATQLVDMVVIPGGDGDYGVMRNHIPLISTVRPGAIVVYEDNQVIDRIFVTGGFAEVTGDKCTVLVESATKVSKLERTAVEQSIRDKTEDLEDAKTDEERDKATLQLAIVKAQLQAVMDAAANQ